MTVFQIVMVSLMAAGFTVATGFCLAFVVEAVKGPKTAKTAPKRTANKARKIEKVVEEKQETKVDESEDIRRMLAQLEEIEEEQYQEPEIVPVSKIETEKELAQEEVIEQVVPVLVEVEEEKEEPVVIPVFEPVVETPAPKAEEIETEIEADDEEETEEDEIEIEETPKTIVIEKVTTETVGTDFDYSVRLAKIVESKNKMERDLQKTKRAITKYERTQRRRARNQKMLDRRAVELTNLNLMMYSVTDIKNVDADKKAKQEELTTHIAELKASIQDADAFLAKNQERYEHDKKMYAFYTKEEARYDDEIRELEILIKNANSVTGSTTTTTTTTTTETV